MMVLGEAAALIAPPNDVVNEIGSAPWSETVKLSVNAMPKAGLVTMSPIAPAATVDRLALAPAAP